MPAGSRSLDLVAGCPPRSHSAQPKSIGPLFTNANTGGPYNWDSLNDAWQKACAEVDIESKMYQGTKHTFATHLNPDERVLQEILGHKDIPVHPSL